MTQHVCPGCGKGKGWVTLNPALHEQNCGDIGQSIWQRKGIPMEETKTMMFTVHALVPVWFSVEADSKEDVIEQVTTLKDYCMSSPDGNRVEINEEDIQSVEPEGEEE